jgi:hypothetical protein
LNCPYTDFDAQRFVDHSMDISEEMDYAKHLSECQSCREKVEEYYFMSQMIFFDVNPPDVREKVYRKFNRNKFTLTLVMASIILGAIFFSFHFIVPNTNSDINNILQALDNSNTNSNSSNAFAEVKAPAYMETSYSYGNW